ncbi:hypothetical protein BD324DRAFT_414583 [Kockovaella imperatae]|uniref:Uncharacterized protein n=1 Tax=Kockovaella imperatae TaxID=4999 RepID=A0A1Y1UKH6_9TREE|nr:hypothetical protein BD324DRAFT_414583 [Kockovaella imperatae]ORX38004.1 hypothetical protein BD324DRAFT_414583 [Kockovaella imperatae]
MQNDAMKFPKKKHNQSRCSVDPPNVPRLLPQSTSSPPPSSRVILGAATVIPRGRPCPSSVFAGSSSPRGRSPRAIVARRSGPVSPMRARGDVDVDTLDDGEIRVIGVPFSSGVPPADVPVAGDDGRDFFPNHPCLSFDEVSAFNPSSSGTVEPFILGEPASDDSEGDE